MKISLNDYILHQIEGDIITLIELLCIECLELFNLKLRYKSSIINKVSDFVWGCLCEEKITIRSEKYYGCGMFCNSVFVCGFFGLYGSV